MILTRNAVATLALVTLLTNSANALCIYKGKMYAKTTVPQEFSDSKWVVEAKVTAADNHWADEGDSWTLYHLRVVKSFKGHPPADIELFTFRDSGGFYLDKGMNPDLGGEYLLFLDSVSPTSHAPAAAHGAVEVNYNCGQSKEWSKVSTADRGILLHLSEAEHVADKSRTSN